MSSTVRQVINDRLYDRKQLHGLGGLSNNVSGRVEEEHCSGQKKLFDLRRHLMITDDSGRLHLEEISGMLSPKRSSDAEKKGLLPAIDPFGIARST